MGKKSVETVLRDEQREMSDESKSPKLQPVYLPEPWPKAGNIQQDRRGQEAAGKGHSKTNDN